MMKQTFEPLDWAKNTNIYEINLRQYTNEGTFSDFAKELPRLKDMGVEVLWFMPITPISVEKRQGTLGSYYACSSYTTINEEFGTLEDFKAIVATAHKLGMKVIIDWVANHTGWDHHWTTDHPEYYRHDANGKFFDANGWIDVIDLDYDNAALREAMIDAMKYWVATCDIDGFRCDMAMLVPLSFWQTARETLDQVKPLFWLGECEETNYYPVFDAQYGWKFLHTLEAYWRNETDLNGIKGLLHEYENAYAAGSLHLLFTSNHDENSHSGSEYERLGFASRACAILTCTWNGIPLLYSGQEMPSRKRLAFFDKDAIEWDGRYQLHDLYRKLFSFRKTNPVFSDPALPPAKILPASHDRLLVFTRTSGASQVLVLLNLSYDDVTSARLYEPPAEGNFRNIFSSHEIYITPGTTFSLKPWEYVVYEKL